MKTCVGRTSIAVIKSLVTTAIFFVVAEGMVRTAYFVRNSLVTYVPLPYVMGDDYGPIPPWLDSLLILHPDKALIWKNTPNARRKYIDIFSPAWRAEDRVALLRRFTPTLPPAFRANPVWEISLNSDGDRGPEIAATKRPAAIRIACLGDSWTFGMNVSQDRTYPSRLAALLRAEHPLDDIEVMNFGVLGYSSFQGLQLLKRRVLALDPDVVVIGFGMNDSEVAGYRDKDLSATERPTLRERVKSASERLEFYRLLRYFALLVTYRPQSTAAALEAEARFKGSGTVDYEEIEPWVRVSPKDYEHNIREMIALARSRGARTILVDNELWDQSPYRPVLRTIARDEHVPLVDSLRIIADARKKMERDLETRLHLEPAPSVESDPQGEPQGEVEVIFRVYAGTFSVPKRLSIVGPDPKLGGLVPNTIAMHDDGTGGDQKAGDGVWSYAATFPVGAKLFYVYTNGGKEGQWEGLDVPTIRHLEVPAAANGGFAPIESFGKIYMQADNWHTDEVGYDLIARAVGDALKAFF